MFAHKLNAWRLEDDLAGRVEVNGLRVSPEAEELAGKAHPTITVEGPVETYSRFDNKTRTLRRVFYRFGIFTFRKACNLISMALKSLPFSRHCSLLTSP